MSELELFFADNVEEATEIEVVVSERFKDKEGNLVKWKLRPLSAEKNNEIKKKATKTVQVPGKKGQYRKEFDANTYIELMTAESIPHEIQEPKNKHL